MMKKLLLSVIAVTAATLCTEAQNVRISGTVTDTTGAPVIGATVVVDGTTTGTATNIAGQYTLSVPENGSLSFSFLGYKTVTIPVNGRTTVDVVMEDDSETIEEVVMLGYGSGRKVGTVIGSVDQVKADKIENRPSTNIMDAMQGQVAGLQISTDNGELNTVSNIRLHGMGSLGTDSTPLILLDGAPISASTLMNINQNDIASITVLKDASATSIYGSRASNGVIYVTTKKGSRGSEDVQVTLRAQYSMSSIPAFRMKSMNTKTYLGYLTDLLNASDYYQEGFQADNSNGFTNIFDWYNDYFYDGSINPDIYTNWADILTKKNAPSYQVDLSVAGGSKKTAYYFSANYTDQEGVFPGSARNRYTFRADVDTRATKWLKLGMALGLGYSKSSMTMTANNSGMLYWTNPVNASFMIQPYQPAYNEDGSSKDFLEFYANQNPLLTAVYTPNSSNRIQMNGSAFVEINPLDGLTLRSSLSATGADARAHSHFSPLWPNLSGEASGTGSVSESFSRSYEWTWTNTAEYLFTVALKNHFGVLLGHETIYGNGESLGMASRGQTNDNFMTIDQGTESGGIPSYGLSEYAFNSVFGRIEYNYDGRYFFDTSIRNDASSRFGRNNRNGLFWSVGAMWNIKQEAFMRDVHYITNLSLKASYGTQGNSNIGNYDQYEYLGSSAPYDGQKTWLFANVGDPNLEWEKQSTLSIGANVEFLRKVSLEVEWYRRQTDNMLMDIPKPLSSGVSSVIGNVGAMRNSGVDVTIRYDIFNNRDWYVNFYTTFNYNRNQLVRMWSPEVKEAVLTDMMQYKVGRAFPNWYTQEWRGVDPETGKGQWTKKDIFGNDGVTNNFDEADLVDLNKSISAPYTGGFGVNVTWKGLSLTADFTWAAGNWMVNNNLYFLANADFGIQYNQIEEVLDYWRQPGDKAKYPSLDFQLNDPTGSGGRQFDSSMLENASYMRLKNLQLSYDFPKSLVQKSGFIQGAKIYIGARNLLTVTKYTGLDPEAAEVGFEVDTYPNTKQWVFGAELRF